MNRLMKMATAAIGVGAMLAFAGCGLEDSMLKGEITKMAQEQFQSIDELANLWAVENTSNFVMEPAANGKRTGSFDLVLKNKKTGAQQKLAYQFIYNDESSEAAVGVKNPSDAVKLLK